MLVTIVLNWRQLAEGDASAVGVSSVPDDPVLALIHSFVELPFACASTAVAASPMRVASEKASVEGSGCCTATGGPIGGRRFRRAVAVHDRHGAAGEEKRTGEKQRQAASRAEASAAMMETQHPDRTH